MDLHKLVKKAQKGNDKAFLELFQQHEESIYRIAYMYLKNKDDALDVVQDTAYQSFKSIDSLREPQYFKTWILKIAINRSIYILRQRKKSIPLPPEYTEQQVASSCEEDIPLSITLQELLDELDTHEKSVIILKFYQGYTFQVISDMLELPLGSTKTILYRGLSKLRKSLKRGEIS
ncbi:sigma-70 family RNA polymerase sigma factor [Paenibacillus sp. ISL-20]|uniref:sigma-70 family RNA polymerase sigma factor n=1 Tax=Paenibacillus sp. ISL-20 TaxID=2819163 RepID=UPI001BE5838D|nr:sigma-70 family RNA polymerase sigma factor [Paenibacillus sp. ISL-20]MBT2765833.1 sigma-70 family RNA polymerase sigma factor [Paenibacillus sp. ISL-20]